MTMGSGMNLITTVIGFGMSATFIIFVCTRIICGRLRGVESRPMFEIESRTDLEQPENRSNGLEQVVVAAIPTMKYDQEAFSSVEDAQCSICLGEYQEKEILRIMPKCGHSFHLSCIDIWLRKQSTCPVCRLPLKESFGPKHVRSATFIVPRSFDDSESIQTHEHSQQWLLPASGPNSASNNVSNQGRLEPAPGNPSEPTQSREPETRH
ncbi:hypothetical protein ACLB2K_072152 [Fragaria x ananassa]